MTGTEGLAVVHDVERREAIMAQLASQLREQVGIDPATGLDSRTRFQARLDQEIKRSARHGHHVAVVVVEVVDDAGCEAHLSSGVLQRVATELRKGLRDIDSVGRVGNARFAALLPTCDSRSAGIAAERVLAWLRQDRSIEVVAGVASTGQVDGWDLLQAAESALELRATLTELQAV